MVIAMVALFAALGGTAIGAKVLSKKQVKKIANTQANQVFDQRKGELQGPQGPPGVTPPVNLVVRTGPSGHGDCFENCQGVYEESNSWSCHPGERATGGGVIAAGGVVTSSGPVFGNDGIPTGWSGSSRVTITTNSAAIPVPSISVICMSEGDQQSPGP
jgi:hypothetical protein